MSSGRITSMKKVHLYFCIRSTSEGLLLLGLMIKLPLYALSTGCTSGSFVYTDVILVNVQVYLSTHHIVLFYALSEWIIRCTKVAHPLECSSIGFVNNRHKKVREMLLCEK